MIGIALGTSGGYSPNRPFWIEMPCVAGAVRCSATRRSSPHHNLTPIGVRVDGDCLTDGMAAQRALPAAPFSSRPSASARQTQRLALLSVISLLSVIALTACAPLACPAIGWSNTLTVQVDGGSSAITDIQLCVDGECAPTKDVDPTGALGQISLAFQVGQTWTFSTGMTALDHFIVRTLQSDGSVLAETEFTPEWVPKDATRQCGGPASATVVITA